MVYLDNQATTPLDPRVLDAMMTALTGEAFGNPNSTHGVGVRANRALESARARLAELTPGGGRRVVFTSGATEANALALFGRAPKGKRNHLVISALEHPSVMATARELERRGCSMTVVRPGREGVVDAEEILGAIGDRTAVVALMAVNNEIGTIQPVGEVAQRISASWPHCHVHVDAAQALGHVNLEGLALASSISISAHKIHGPKGVGALVYQEKHEPRPLWFGGGQERGVRSGTQNVAGALGLARAVELALEGWSDEALRLASLRDDLVDGITGEVDGTHLVGHAVKRSPANAVIAASGLTGDALVGALEQRGVIASTGAACHSNASGPSAVLEAIGHDLGAGTVRFGLSRLTTEQEIQRAVWAFTDAVRTLRK